MSDSGHQISRRRWLALCSSLALGDRAVATTADEPLVLSNVTLLDGRRPAQAARTVILRGDRISEITGSQANGAEHAGRVVDCSGKFLIPGLWDMHVHLSYTKASALPILLANGVTSVRDCGGRLSEIDLWRGQILAGAMAGPRVFRAGPMLNGRFADYQLLVADAAEARGAVRALQRAGVDFIKIHRMTSRDAYWGVVKECKSLNLPLGGHIPRTVSPEEASDAGQGTIEHVETLFEGVFSGASDDLPLAEPIRNFKKNGARQLFDRFAKNGNRFDPTLTAFQGSIRCWSASSDPRDRYTSRSSKGTLAAIRKNPPPSAWIEDRKAQFPEHLELAGMAHQAGVDLVTGTDLAAAMIYPGFSLHDEMELLVQGGVPPIGAIQAATYNSARAMMRPDLGLIEAGKLADLVILDRDPLQDIRNVGRIHAVVSNGNLLDRTILDKLLTAAEELAKNT